jgi:hypothetical protein
MREVMRGPFGEADLVAVGLRRVGPPTPPGDYCPDTLKKSYATPPPARNVMREVMRGPFGEADLVAVGGPQARRVGPPTPPADYCPDTLKSHARRRLPHEMSCARSCAGHFGKQILSLLARASGEAGGTTDPPGRLLPRYSKSHARRRLPHEMSCASACASSCHVREPPRMTFGTKLPSRMTLRMTSRMTFAQTG